MTNRSLAPCKEFSFFVRTTKIGVSRKSSSAPAEVGIEISSHNYRAAGEISDSHSVGRGKLHGTGFGMDFSTAN